MLKTARSAYLPPITCYITQNEVDRKNLVAQRLGASAWPIRCSLSIAARVACVLSTFSN